MGSQDYQIIRNFISKEEANKIVSWVESLNQEDGDANHHLSYLSDELKGTSSIFDISKTKETNYITNFQAISKIHTEDLPEFVINFIYTIANKLNLPTNHIFLQALDMNNGGKIGAHYDASVDGFVNYKCNISLLTEDYDFHIDKNILPLKELDLYCFEASLYKHWTDEFNSRRVFLSIGFLVPYEFVGRDENDPRVRLSKRMEKYFQAKAN
jgi:hypothetical protein